MDISSALPFSKICFILDEVAKKSKVPEKEKYLRRYYESFMKYRTAFRQEKGIDENQEETGASSFHSILRCLIPKSDNSREAYGLQINTLGKVYIKVLQLPEDSRDAQRLHARSYSGIRGDYADVVYSVLMPRCQQLTATITLKEVHDMLDTIASDDRRNTERVLTRLSEIATAKEQMWFIRLLLKSMHLGIGEQRIFGILHPQAQALYQRCSSLARVCCRLADNKLSADTKDNGIGDQLNLNAAIEPFQHLRPMLCQRFDGKIQTLMADDVLYVETKMDGERFQLHYQNGTFKYISRNGVDYTYSFGNNGTTGNLTPQLVHLLPIGLQSIILDGEMMVWDTDQFRFRDKGENTDVKHLSGRTGWRPCFVVYDMLFLNGKSLLDMPFAQRTHKMRTLLKEERGVLQTMKSQKVTTVESFRDMFQQALDASEEGVVVKKENSVYRPGMRQNGGWYKVKSDYFKDLITEFDLIIIGGFYNRTRTYIKSYLLGVLKYESPQKFEVYSVGKVDSYQRLATLGQSLKPHWHPLASEPPPMWYHYSTKSDEGRPDVWIEPKNSSILQIRAADLAPSAAFYLPKSVHFPRIQSWRNDKVWNEAMSLEEFKQTIEGRGNLCKIHQRKVSLTDVTTDQKVHKITAAQKRKLGKEAYEKRFDPAGIQQTSALLAGYSICILSANFKDGTTPESLKALVVQNGGEIVENPIDNPMCISVAGEITYRVERLQKLRRFNIVNTAWLVKICENQKMQLRPQDMVCMTDELKEQFAERFDKYGDSYTNSVSLEELEEILDKMSDDELSSSVMSSSQLLQLEDDLLGKRSPYFFRHCHAHFYANDRLTELSKLLFRGREGIAVELSDLLQINKVSYVFINAFTTADKLNFKSWLNEHFGAQLSNLKIVNINWILDSDKAKEKLDVREYTWHDF